MRTALTTPVKVAIALVVTFIITVYASGRIDDYECDGQSVNAKQGETLWSIHERHCTGNISQAVDDYIKAHGVVYLQVGDTVQLEGK